MMNIRTRVSTFALLLLLSISSTGLRAQAKANASQPVEPSVLLKRKIEVLVSDVLGGLVFANSALKQAEVTCLEFCKSSPVGDLAASRFGVIPRQLGKSFSTEAGAFSQLVKPRTVLRDKTESEIMEILRLVENERDLWKNNVYGAQWEEEKLNLINSLWIRSRKKIQGIHALYSFWFEAERVRAHREMLAILLDVGFLMLETRVQADCGKALSLAFEYEQLEKLRRYLEAARIAEQRVGDGYEEVTNE